MTRRSCENVSSAHYKAYADSLSWGEARAFAQNVRELSSSLSCPHCSASLTA
jgi:hypothetical protein